jgi:hypothetical protein
MKYSFEDQCRTWNCQGFIKYKDNSPVAIQKRRTQIAENKARILVSYFLANR